MEKEIVERRGCFEVTSRKSVYKCNWCEVVEDEVRNVDNNHVSVFSNIYSKHAVAVLPIDDAGNVYLNKEYKYAVNKDIISLASGFIEEGEEHLDAAKRELKEETGFTAKNWIPMGEIFSYGSVMDAKYYLYLAKQLTNGETDFDTNEKITLIKIPFTEAYEMVMKGEITFVPAVALILKAKELKNNH